VVAIAENSLSGQRPWNTAASRPQTVPSVKPRIAARIASTKVFASAAMSWPQTGVALNTERPKSPRSARPSHSRYCT
jgi:hypothetical protein